MRSTDTPDQAAAIASSRRLADAASWDAQLAQPNGPDTNVLVELPVAHPLSLRIPARHVANNVAASVIQFVGRGALAIVAPAFLAPNDYGTFAYSVWLISIAMQAGQCGFIRAAQRYVPLLEREGRDRSAAAFLARTATVASVLIFALLVLLSHWLQPTQPLPPEVCLTAVLIVLATAYANIRTAVCQGYGHFGRITRVESRALAARMAAVALLFAFRSHTGILAFLLAELWTQAVRALQLSGGPGRAPTGTALPRSVVRPMLAYAAAIWTVGVFDMVISQRVEVGFLNAMSGYAAAGYFSLASQLVFMLTVFPSAAVQAVFPTLALMSARNPGHFRSVNSALFSLSVALSAPLFFIGCAVLPAFISVYKHDYAPVIPLIPFLCFGRVLLFVSSPLSTSLFASGNHKVLLKVVLLSAGPGLMIDYLLIRHFGLKGAGIGAAVIQSTAALATMVVARSITKHSRPLEARTLFVAAATFVATALATHYTRAWALACVLLPICCWMAWRDKNIRELRRALAASEDTGGASQ